jgi:hypothetical protein
MMKGTARHIQQILLAQLSPNFGLLSTYHSAKIGCLVQAAGGWQTWADVGAQRDLSINLNR